MTRKKTEINPIRAERIKTICKNEGITQTQLAESICMTQQNLSRIMTLKNAVTDLTVDRITEIYPKYRKQWLRGDDDYMTNTDLILGTMQKTNAEGNLLLTGFLAFARLNDYQVDFNPIYGTGSIETVFENMKKHCIISKEGRSVTFSLEQLNQFENEICDYVAFRLDHIMK